MTYGALRLSDGIEASGRHSSNSSRAKDMMFQCDADGTPHYAIPRVAEIWPLLDYETDLIGDERAVYKALSTRSGEIDGAMLPVTVLASKLGWSVQRVDNAADSLWERWIKPHL